MIEEYLALLDEVESTVSPMDFKRFQDDEYEAIFKNESGWFVSFEGERYVMPAFELSIGKEDLKFSVRLLMTVFNVADKPSLSRQLKFIEERSSVLFVSPPPYLAEYQRLNQVV